MLNCALSFQPILLSVFNLLLGGLGIQVQPLYPTFYVVSGMCSKWLYMLSHLPSPYFTTSAFSRHIVFYIKVQRPHRHSFIDLLQIDTHRTHGQNRSINSWCTAWLGGSLKSMKTSCWTSISKGNHLGVCRRSPCFNCSRQTEEQEAKMMV